jgi:predicted GNAT family acetyltransferase
MEQTDTGPGAVRDNAEESRFELSEQGKLAFADYSRNGDILVLPHVEAHPDLRGTGAASRLMDGVIRHAREHGLKVRPVCSYAVAYMRRHREHQDLLA